MDRKRKIISDIKSTLAQEPKSPKSSRVRFAVIGLALGGVAVFGGYLFLLDSDTSFRPLVVTVDPLPLNSDQVARQEERSERDPILDSWVFDD